MRYLAAREVLIIHALVIDETGGLHGVRDLGLLESAIHRPRSVFGGKELYVGVLLKAAALFESLARNHPFTDGNKRTAIVTTARFLSLNGYKLVTTSKELERFTLSAVTKKLSITAIARWLEKHAKKLR
ncbi:MAG: type II toxin-antitoxin system death-on-curing family toxin [Patescibacteria group bacterium]